MCAGWLISSALCCNIPSQGGWGGQRALLPRRHAGWGRATFSHCCCWWQGPQIQSQSDWWRNYKDDPTEAKHNQGTLTAPFYSASDVTRRSRSTNCRVTLHRLFIHIFFNQLTQPLCSVSAFVMKGSSKEMANTVNTEFSVFSYHRSWLQVCLPLVATLELERHCRRPPHPTPPRFVLILKLQHMTEVWCHTHVQVNSYNKPCFSFSPLFTTCIYTLNKFDLKVDWLSLISSGDFQHAKKNLTVADRDAAATSVENNHIVLGDNPRHKWSSNTITTQAAPVTSTAFISSREVCLGLTASYSCSHSSSEMKFRPHLSDKYTNITIATM